MLSCTERQRNVQIIITHVQSHCSAHLFFCFVTFLLPLPLPSWFRKLPIKSLYSVVDFDWETIHIDENETESIHSIVERSTRNTHSIIYTKIASPFIHRVESGNPVTSVSLLRPIPASWREYLNVDLDDLLPMT